MEVFDLSGRRIGTIVEGELQGGAHSIIWDLTDSSGLPVPAGVYHVRMTAPGYEGTSSVVVLR